MTRFASIRLTGAADIVPMMPAGSLPCNAATAQVAGSTAVADARSIVSAV
jgi:hypothetical protein